jgi:hypothetical protein
MTKYWIQGALKHHRKGSLHRQLGVPLNKKIPLKLLNRATHSNNLLLKRRAILAKTLRNFHKHIIKSKL